MSNGSETDALSSHPSVTEVANLFSVTTDELRVILLNHGIPTHPYTRLPVGVILGALERNGGFAPSRLWSLRTGVSR